MGERTPSSNQLSKTPTFAIRMQPPRPNTFGTQKNISPPPHKDAPPRVAPPRTAPHPHKNSSHHTLHIPTKTTPAAPGEIGRTKLAAVSVVESPPPMKPVHGLSLREQNRLKPTLPDPTHTRRGSNDKHHPDRPERESRTHTRIRVATGIA